MSKHTPGSWQYDGSVGVYRDGDTDDISNLVALVYSSDLTGNLADNARLISAAPDMAEALRRLCHYANDVREDGQPPSPEDWRNAWEAARAALKKAGIQ